MININIVGPAASGKTVASKALIPALERAGFVVFHRYEADTPVPPSFFKKDGRKAIVTESQR